MLHLSLRGRLPREHPPLSLQPRDLALLSQVFFHGYIRSDQLHALVCSEVSLRAVQGRLKKLYDHSFLKRLYLPVVLGSSRPAVPAQPIYALGRPGAELLAEHGLFPELDTTGWSETTAQPRTLAHHLVVTDALVALAVACRSRGDIELVKAEHERVLWQRLRRYREAHHVQDAVVPDGAFSLRYPAAGEALTFYLEVVRADVKGGNRQLTAKLRRYAEFHRAGFFRDAYGHERVRAVIFATTSDARAENLRRLAERLAHGRRLFWFGAYQGHAPDGRLPSRFTAEHILDLSWQAAGGECLTLLQPRSSSPEKGVT